MWGQDHPWLRLLRRGDRNCVQKIIGKASKRELVSAGSCRNAKAKAKWQNWKIRCGIDLEEIVLAFLYIEQAGSGVSNPRDLIFRAAKDAHLGDDRSGSALD